jgi:hypothetical protein
VTKIKRQSIKTYFFERCAGGPKSKDFWPTIKPFLSNKGVTDSKHIILQEDDKIVTDQSHVCETFNDFFVNVAKDIGSDLPVDTTTHPSILAIQSSHRPDCTFNFSSITTDFVSKQIDGIGLRKATGNDGISAKILKMAKPAICQPLTDLVNRSIASGSFPDKLKEAQVVPIFKKKCASDKSNYRPVSILPITSKFFERALNTQLAKYFDSILHPYLSAFRKGFGCQTVLLRALEDWRMALDNNQYAAAILIDLSKAFDCLPHDLLLSKLKAYGLSSNALEIMSSYLTNRKQSVRIGTHTSKWSEIAKGVPQGSILGPLLFNVFINDIFQVVDHSTMYNYADDNTLFNCHKDVETVKANLEHDASKVIQWFDQNQMKANPDKFQGLPIGKKTRDKHLTLNINSSTIECNDHATLLGVTIDYQLNFDSYLSDLCKKASRQLNVLKRIGKYLTKQGKLTIYHSFILSNFNYCPLAWHFCSIANTKKIEKIQERALRFVYLDYTSSYESLLQQSKLPSLHVRRLRQLALETFKLFHKQAPIYLHDLITPKHNHYSFRYVNNLSIPRVKSTKYGLKSFRYTAAKLWNELPNDIRATASYAAFSSLLTKWNGKLCHCSVCE